MKAREPDVYDRAETGSTVSEKPFSTTATASLGPGRMRTVVIALSLANLCLITAWFASHFDQDYGYFNKLAVSRKTTLAMLTNLLLLSLIFWWAAEFARRTRRSFITLVADLSLAGLLLIPLDFIRFYLLHIADHQIVDLLKNPFGILATLTLIALLFRSHRRVAQTIAFLLVVLSPLAVLTLARSFLILAGVNLISQADAPRGLVPLQTATNSARVVWIIFDELDYRVTFANRPADLKLPEFDRVCAESFTATAAYPPAGATILSIPALTTGESVIAAAPANASELSLKVGPNGPTTNWTRLPTVFSQGRRSGANVAIVGWYHPYDRLFSSSASFCEWFTLSSFEPARAATVAETMKRELCAMIGPVNLRFLHAQNVEQALRASRTAVTNQNFGLTFLHVPIPHKPGIYLHEQQKVTFLGVSGTRGYLGNVAMADRFFGTLRHDMEHAGVWNKTWIIISSDHWWRKRTGNLGTTDYRVPFIVKSPDPHPELYDTPFNTIVTHNLVLAILRGEFGDRPQLASWMDTHHADAPRAYLRESAAE